MSKKARARRQRKGKGRGQSEGQRRGKARQKKLSADRKIRRPKRSRRKPVAARQKTKSQARRSQFVRRLEAAVREMNRGRSLTATARAFGLDAKALRQHLGRKGLLKRKGKRWVTKDNRLRRVSVMSGGRPRALIVRGFEPAHLVGQHHQAVGEFVRTNDINLLKPFSGQAVRAANGRRYLLETDPNVLHRIAAMDSPPFHEIYAITSEG